ncbi:N-acetyltransferase [Pseudoflavonifractor sp. 60]|uniref:GNAT family N-acetyltransferase n=1 Tax=Pseudoflavonifractor sp. 60 TaxID=2304576 RepID=UPI00136F4635|nr:GNAT family N-acetyltransferase [Pseudoflavonifractor sp. 60]NBI67677.1 N-acetyltransferase [Pseudoflavonifractor sp. 60]
MNIVEITADKKKYLPLLLLADEQESMIDRYLDRGTMFALEDGAVQAVCVVTDEGAGVLELKNIAVDPRFQRRGLGRALVAFLLERYAGAFQTLRAGTGDSPLTIPFYESCGFRRAYVVKNFFLDHYDKPIFECGRQLTHMVYLERPIPLEVSRP